MNERRLGLVLVMVAVVALCAAQVLFKFAFQRYGSIPVSLDVFQYLATALHGWELILALAFMLLSSLLWYAGVSRLPLSYASPITSLAYPIILLASIWLLSEDVTVSKLLGNALIVLGIFISGTSRSSESV